MLYRPNWYRPVLGLIAMAIVAIVQWGPSNNGSTTLSNAAQATTCTAAERALGNDCPDDPAAPAAPAPEAPAPAAPAAPATPPAASPTTSMVDLGALTVAEAETWCKDKDACKGRWEVASGNRVHLKSGDPVEVQLPAKVCGSNYDPNDQTSAVTGPVTVSSKEMTVGRLGCTTPGSGNSHGSTTTTRAPRPTTTTTTEPPAVLPTPSRVCDPIYAFNGGVWSPVGPKAWLFAGKSLNVDTVPEGWTADVDGARLVAGDPITSGVFTARCL